MKTKREIWKEAEQIAFEHGGWLALACKMQMTRDALRRQFSLSGAGKAHLEEWLGFIKSGRPDTRPSTLVPASDE